MAQRTVSLEPIADEIQKVGKSLKKLARIAPREQRAGIRRDVEILDVMIKEVQAICGKTYRRTIAPCDLVEESVRRTSRRVRR